METANERAACERGGCGGEAAPATGNTAIVAGTGVGKVAQVIGAGWRE